MSFSPADLDVLEKTKQVRLKIIDTLTQDKLPEDPELLNVILKAAGETDKSIINVARVKVEESSLKNAEETRRMIAKTIMENKMKRAQQPTTGEIPKLPDDIIRENPVPGEIEIEASRESYEEFVQRVNNA